MLQIVKVLRAFQHYYCSASKTRTLNTFLFCYYYIDIGLKNDSYYYRETPGKSRQSPWNRPCNYGSYTINEYL